MAPFPQALKALSLPGNWSDNNHSALRHWLTMLPKTAYTAAFDWDNTCIYNDIGDAALRYQLDRLLLWHDPKQLEARIAARLGQHAYPDLTADVICAYRQLWPHIARGQGARRRGHPAHLDFRAKFAALYECAAHDAVATPEQTAQAYALLADLWAPASQAQVRTHARRIVALGNQEALGFATWRSSTPGRAGPTTWRYATGLRPHDEIRGLMAAMQRRNVTPWVVSASDQRLVRAAAAAWGYPLAQDHILGICPIAPLPITYRAGKVLALGRALREQPIFAAGDAITDLEMLTAVPSLQMRLVIHRASQQSHLKALLDAADAPPGPGAPVTLVQGRHAATGAFNRAARST